jgi:hypothetical protein
MSGRTARGQHMTRNEEEERRMIIKMIELLTSMAKSQQEIALLLEVLVTNLNKKDSIQ